MNIVLHRFGTSIEVAAGDAGLAFSSFGGAIDLAARESWPADALSAPGGWRTALELEQLTELGLAEASATNVVVPYSNFKEIDEQIPVSLVHAWSEPSPFLLQIDRKGDIGRPDFLYRYQLLLAGQRAYGDRVGYYFKRAGSGTVFRLDHQMFSLLEAMDRFNELAPEHKTAQTSWLCFAQIKGCAKEVGATLDQVLMKNDVVVPSVIGLDIHNNPDGTLSFLPKSESLATAEFQQAFERNSEAQNLYSIDQPGSGRLRVVLSDQQQEVLRRMKRIRRVSGAMKERIIANPEQVFDGVLESVELPDPSTDYGERVIGIGTFEYTPIPRQPSDDLSMGALWKEGVGPTTGQTTETGTDSDPTEGGTERNTRSAGGADAPAPPDTPASQGHTESGSTEGNARGSQGPNMQAEAAAGVAKSKMSLLIDTNEEFVKEAYLKQAQSAAGAAPQTVPFQRPAALLSGTELKPHQEQGVQWMQTCVSTPNRKGILLADDMGLGKTLQILTFLAWCIESGRFPDLACSIPPFRPILIVVPLILLENRTWEVEMERFFESSGSLFWPVEHLHGSRISHYRRTDVDGPEAEAMRPALDLDRIRRNRVVVTNYETLKNFQYSFAYCPGGQSIWSAIISDEAQEFKIPSTRISHAMKSLKAEFQIACTGTPVENRLLDLWNLYDVVQPGLLASAREFVGQFESRLRGEERAEVFGELKLRLLFQQPHAFLLRREKKDVASLPPKTPKRLMCAMSETEIDLHQRLLGELRAGSRTGRHLLTLQRFAQLYQHPSLLTGGSEDGAVVETAASD
jgi:SNF2-related domain